MNRRLLAQIGVAACIAALGVAHGVSDEVIGQKQARQEAAQHDAETTTIELKLDSKKVKEVEVTLCQSAKEVFKRLEPVPVAADDDPWLLYAAARGGHYALFFCAEGTVREMKGRLNPGRDKLNAVVHYPTEAQVDGKFLLPEKMRGTTVGEFFTLKVQLSPQKARVATVALGMSSKDVLDLYRPETDHAVEDHAIVYDSIDDDGRYLLIFSSRDDGGTHVPKLDALSQVIYQPRAQAESTYLLPRSKRGELVPAMYKPILEEARAHREKGAIDESK
jgi:hypothetical protein